MGTAAETSDMASPERRTYISHKKSIPFGACSFMCIHMIEYNIMDFVTYKCIECNPERVPWQIES